MSLDHHTQAMQLPAVDNDKPSSMEDRTESSRDGALDFTKGALVLFMVLYHWLNYFVGPFGQYYKYLRFLTPSFIFISGYVISQIQLSRTGYNVRRLASRLTVRGLKLLVLVILLNALVSFAAVRFVVRPAALMAFLHNVCRALIVANPLSSEGRKGVAFSMLVPIAYLLILSALVVVSTKREKYAFRFTLLVLIAAVISTYVYGVPSSYLELLMVGVLGVVIGSARSEQIALFLGRPYVLVLLYCCYLVMITVWYVTPPLQVVSVILTTALLYVAGRTRTPGLLWRRTVLLGKYSLLGYISQIAVLQGLRRVSWLSERGVIALLVSLLMGTLLTLAIVEVADLARRRSPLADSIYRLVFA